MGGVSITAEVSGLASAAMAHGKFGAVRRIEVFNNAAEPTGDILVTVRSEPPVLVERSYEVSGIRPGDSIELTPDDCVFDIGALMDAGHATGKVFVEARSDGEVLAAYSSDLEISPAGGVPGAEDALFFSAHVDPNGPLAERIHSDLASSGLELPDDGYWKASRDGICDVFDALADAVSQGFRAIEGDEIRPQAEIADAGECNPWESVALRCSVLERMGLNPLAVVSGGVPACGLWLYDGALPNEVVYEPDSIAMNVDEGYVAIDPVPLSASDFSYAVDIAESRRLVQPMGDGPVVEWEPRAERQYTRKEQWERKLLDISLRNNLINMRRTARVVPLMVGDVSRFYDRVSSGAELELAPRPENWSGADVFEKFPMEPGRYVENALERVTGALAEGRAVLPLTEGALATAAATLYRQSRKEMEENGSNSFFIGLGALRWYEASSPDVPRYSPLILVPASIERRRGKGYSVKAIDEETILNVTLAEKLRGEYGIDLPAELPLRRDGTVNVTAALGAVRKAVRTMREWDVVQTAVLGIFSFNQFVMWKDITTFPGLEENKIVKSLMESRLCWPAEPVDDPGEPYDVCLTLPADSSQIRAVRASGAGKSFVLHGPPGTGKSQTITNIISNALFEGKTVLFVAEKMAALEVVQRRLEEIGIGNHCLELHSNKAERGAVMEQLRSSLERCKPADGEEYGRKTRRLLEAKEALDRYATALHSRLPCGITVHDAISRYEAHTSSNTFDVAIDESILETATVDDFDDWEYHVTKMSKSRGIFGNRPDNPFLLIGSADVSIGAAERAKPLLERLASASRGAISVNMKIKGLGLPDGVSDFKGVRVLSGFLEMMDPVMLTNPKSVMMPGAAQDLLDALGESDRFMGSLARVSEQEASTHSARADGVLTALRNAYGKLDAAGSGLRLSAVERRIEDMEFINGIVSAAGDDVQGILAHWKVGVFDLNRQVDLAMFWRQANEAGFLRRKKAAAKFMDTFGFALKDPTIRFKDVPKVLRPLTDLASKVERVRGIVTERLRGPAAENLATDIKELEAFRDRAGAHLEMIRMCGGKPADAAEAMAKIADSEGLSDEIAEASAEYDEAYAAVRDHLSLNEDMETPEESLWFSNAVLGGIGKLPDWTLWNAQCREARSMGLGGVVDAVAAGGDPEWLPASFSKALYKAVAERGMSGFPELSEFRSDSFEADVAEFRRMDAEYMELNREILRHRLRERIPSKLDGSVDGSETNTLYRAINTQRSRKSIRTLFSEIPNLLPRMCPCMLMSPLSVAQYLSPDYPKFDIVVFDEASQIPTHKAIGALARAGTAIIVGDPKQLPPTTFFESKLEGETDQEELEDMDSLLEDCLALPMPESHLEWHYRSRHESLISFSNHVYYGNRMLTFPSPNDIESKVSFRLVDGVYDKGGRRTNEAEAEAVVEEALRRLSEGGHSIGIVAFSKAQQEKIDDLLWARLDRDEALYSAAVGGREPLFVKNLENVQGDERDVILFSVGYGPDASGRVTNNFGPINKAGGGRRLNVAVSRARHEMVVFSSMRAERIRLNPGTPDGVRHLRRFLEFAQNGGRFGPAGGRMVRAEGSPMAASIAAALAERGYETRFDVGGSGFRIDVAVIDPDDKDRYILGIMADGENYRDSGNTRDREFAREEVLRGLGWNVFRVWSIEWMYNRDEVVDRICAAMEEAVEQAESLEPRRDGEEVYVPVPDDGLRLTYERAHVEPRIAGFEDALVGRINIINLANGILREEAPVTESYLVQRISDAFPDARLTPKNRKALLGIIGDVCTNTTMFGREKTYWDRYQLPSRYLNYRVPKEGGLRREADHIPVEEMANAVVDLVDRSVSVDVKDLIRSVSKEFGFYRTGPRIEEAVERGIELAEVQGRIAVDGGRAHAVGL
ncbi:MAG: DUF4011 domain-containing protein [Thermoplasmatales archaeon]|nr:DUF4011 domain-containing protein [Thermoplasmatales archaeon]